MSAEPAPRVQRSGAVRRQQAARRQGLWLRATDLQGIVYNERGRERHLHFTHPYHHQPPTNVTTIQLNSLIKRL